MALVKWDPFSDLINFQSQVNSLINDSFGSAAGGNSSPSTDVYSNDKELCIESHLPGFVDNEITVEQHEGDLAIRAEHQEKEESKDKKYLLRESVNRYYRRFSLPRNADADNIKAEFKDGILKLSIPYKELPKPKRVVIKAKNNK